MKRLATEYNKPKLILSAFLFLVYFAITIYCTRAPLEAIWTWACAIIFVFLSGLGFALFLQRIKGTHIPAYMLPLLSIILGCGAFAVVFCFTARLDIILFMLLPPIIAALLCIKQLSAFIKGARLLARSRAVSFLQRNANYILLWSFLLLLYATSVCIPAARPSITGITSYPHADFLWYIGNAKSFLLGFPPESMRFSGVRLSYHYFTELFWGGVSRLSGVDAYNIIMFYSAPLSIAALITSLRSLGAFFYKESRKKTAVFIGLLLFGSCSSTIFLFFNSGQSIFLNNNLIHLLTNINSQATASIFLCGFTALLGLLSQHKFKVHPFQLMLTALCFVLLSVSKGPTAAIVICSFLISMLITMLFSRPSYLRALLLTVSIVGLFYIIYITFFASGANNSVVFSPNTIQSFVAYTWLSPISDKLRLAVFGAVIICIVQAVLTLPLQSTMYFPVLWRDLKINFKLPTERLMAHGCIVGGLLAFALFWHSGGSHVYFLYVAIFFISLISADFDFKLPKFAKPLYALSGGVALITSVCLVLSMLVGVYRPTSHGALTVSADTALGLLKQVSRSDELFATNRVNSAPQRADGISNICTAISGRQAYMEGYIFEKTNMGISNAVVAEHMDNNNILFSENATAEQISRICAENNIAYILYFEEYGGSNASVAAVCEELYNSDGVYLYKLIAA